MNAIEHLIQDNEKLVYKQLHRFNLGFNEDAYSYAMEALFKAASNYDANSGTAFSTYAMACIYNGIMMYFRDVNKKRVDTLSIEEHTTPNGVVLIPNYEAEGPSAEEEALQHLSGGLQPVIDRTLKSFRRGTSTYKCISAWIESDFTLSTIALADKVGCAQATSSKAINAFRDRLKEEIQNEKAGESSKSAAHRRRVQWYECQNGHTKHL